MTPFSLDKASGVAEVRRDGDVWRGNGVVYSNGETLPQRLRDSQRPLTFQGQLDDDGTLRPAYGDVVLTGVTFSLDDDYTRVSFTFSKPPFFCDDFSLDDDLEWFSNETVKGFHAHALHDAALHPAHDTRHMVALRIALQAALELQRRGLQ